MKRPPPPRLERRPKVTVCIAAACREADRDDNTAIILCADRKASSSLGHLETAWKHYFLHQHFMLQMSGDDDSDVNFTAQSLGAHFAQATHDGVKIDETNAASIILNALQTVKEHKANEITIREWGLGYVEFLKRAKDTSIAPELLADTSRRIQLIEPKVAFIVSGFASAMPLIFEFNTYQGLRLCDELAVVGSGQYLAQAILMRRQHSEYHTRDQVIYEVFEAKKWAEAEPHVGKATVLCIQRPASHQYIMAAGIDFLEAEYAAHNSGAFPYTRAIPEGSFFAEEKADA